MKKNASGQQYIGSQMITAADGTAFTGAVTVYVTGDAGTQALGSVGSGACTHEGNGYHTYAPAQAETNYDLVAFTFIGTGAIPTTVQVYTIPTTGLLAPATAGRTLAVNASGLASVDVINWDSVDLSSIAILPTVAAGANGGLPTVDGNNRIAGIQGTITTLDGLDTAQDTQHSTTQGTLSSVSSAIGSPVDLGSGSTIAENLSDMADNNSATFNASTDCLQAIRDRGDAAWITATSVTVSDKTGFSLSAAGIDAIWDEATAGHVTAGTYGVAVTDILTDTAEIGAAGVGLTEAGGTGDHLTAVIGADADTLKTLSDQIDGIAAGSSPQLLQNTTITGLSTQTEFNLTAGSSDNDAYNGAVAIITDASTSTQKAFVPISDYSGASKTVFLSASPAFTIANGDTIDIVAAASDAPTAAAIRSEIDSNSTQLAAIVADTNELQTDWADGGRLDLIADAILVDTNSLNDTKIPQTLNLTASGNIGIDWANVENPTSIVDLSATDIQLCDTVTNNSDMRGTDSAALASVCTEVRLAELGAANLPADVDAILADTNSLDGTKIPDTLSLANINTQVDTAFTTQMADSVSTDGTIATREQALYMVLQALTEFSISGTTVTVKKVDGSTTLFTCDIGDNTNPTSSTRDG